MGRRRLTCDEGHLLQLSVTVFEYGQQLAVQRAGIRAASEAQKQEAGKVEGRVHGVVVGALLPSLNPHVVLFDGLPYLLLLEAFHFLPHTIRQLTQEAQKRGGGGRRTIMNCILMMSPESLRSALGARPNRWTKRGAQRSQSEPMAYQRHETWQQRAKSFSLPKHSKMCSSTSSGTCSILARRDSFQYYCSFFGVIFLAWCSGIIRDVTTTGV